MKKLFLIYLMAYSSIAWAVNPSGAELLERFDSGVHTIDEELVKLNKINSVVITNNFDFNDLARNNKELVASANLSHRAAEGIFDGHPDNPIGIPAFWWGCCLGWIGILIVYMSMDEGEHRKQQVRNAISGCLVMGIIYLLLNFLATLDSLN